jgi:hypothetical protein
VGKCPSPIEARAGQLDSMSGHPSARDYLPDLQKNCFAHEYGRRFSALKTPTARRCIHCSAKSHQQQFRPGTETNGDEIIGILILDARIGEATTETTTRWPRDLICSAAIFAAAFRNCNSPNYLIIYLALIRRNADFIK